MWNYRLHYVRPLNLTRHFHFALLLISECVHLANAMLAKSWFIKIDMTAATGADRPRLTWSTCFDPF